MVVGILGTKDDPVRLVEVVRAGAGVREMREKVTLSLIIFRKLQN